MELKLESRIGRLRREDSQIYGFLSDCNNFQQFADVDKVQGWQSDSDSCSFSIAGAGEVVFRIVERRPYELVKFSIDNAQAENILLWVQLKSPSPGDTRLKLTTKLDVNPVVRMFISKPLQQGLDKIVETLERFCS